MNRRLHKHDKQSRGRQALAGQRQPQWQCASCYTAQLPQQRHLLGVWKGEKVTQGVVCRREGSDCALATPERWRDDLSSGIASSQHSEGTSPSSCADSASAGAGKGAGDAQRLHPCFGVQSDERRGRDSTSSAHGTDHGPGASQISSSCRGGREGTKKPCSRPRRTSSKRSRRSVQAQLDLHELTQEAPLPVMPALQVNVNLVKSWEALTGLVENKKWNPEAGPPPDPLIHAIQESRVILHTSSAILAQEGGAAVEAETGADQDQDEGEAEEMADFEEAHAPGGPPVEPRQTRKAAAERAPQTPPQQKKTRTTEPEASRGGAPLSQVQLRLPRSKTRGRHRASEWSSWLRCGWGRPSHGSQRRCGWTHLRENSSSGSCAETSWETAMWNSLRGGVQRWSGDG